MDLAIHYLKVIGCEASTGPPAPHDTEALGQTADRLSARPGAT
jgi:hypothetical protein